MATIAIVGLARSGKDTAADYIARKYGYAKYTFSDVLKEMIEARGGKATKEKMLGLGNLVRKRMGMGGVAKILAKKIKEKDKALLVGARSVEEINYFRKRFPELIVIKVSSAKATRFERKTESDPKGKGKFFSRDKEDIREKGMQKALEAAQMELKNDSTKKELHRKIDLLMGKIWQEKA